MSYVASSDKTSNHPGDSDPLHPSFSALQLLAFPKTKITFEIEEISDHQWDSWKYNGQLMAIRRTVWGLKVPTLKGTEEPLSYTQCFLYLIPSSINVSIFHSTWLDTFWTNLIYYIQFSSSLTHKYCITNKIVYVFELILKWYIFSTNSTFLSK